VACGRLVIGVSGELEDVQPVRESRRFPTSANDRRLPSQYLLWIGVGVMVSVRELCDVVRELAALCMSFCMLSYLLPVDKV